MFFCQVTYSFMKIVVQTYLLLGLIGKTTLPTLYFRKIRHFEKDFF